MSKKLEQKQARRLAEERKRAEQRREARRRNLLTIGIAILVIGAVTALIISDRQQDEGPIGVSAAEANCGEVERNEAQGRAHINPGDEHPPYNADPPNSGPHYGPPNGPINAGFYQEAVPPEAVLHNLEHGQIVIWYRPDAPQETIDYIEALVDDEPLATVAVPYDGIEDRYGFVMTAWLAGEGEEDDGTGVSQACEQVSGQVVNAFREDFQGRSPEPLTARFEA